MVFVLGGVRGFAAGSCRAGYDAAQSAAASALTRTRPETPIFGYRRVRYPS